MKNIWIALFILLSCKTMAAAVTPTSSVPSAYMVENTTGTGGCYLFQTSPSCFAQIQNLNVAISSGAIVPGSTNYIQNTGSPTTSTQVFSVSTGTVTNYFIVGSTGLIVNVATGRASIGATSPTRTLDILSTDNNGLLVEGTATGPTSMLVVQNTGGGQQPFFGLFGSASRWGTGIDSSGSYVWRQSSTAFDPVVGTPLASITTGGVVNASSFTAHNIVTDSGTITLVTVSTITASSATITNLSSQNIIVTTITPTGIVGTTTNNNAPLGDFGEVISSQIVRSVALPLTTALYNDISTITLTAGDWDVRVAVAFLPGGATSITEYCGAIGLTANTRPGIDTEAAPNSSGEIYMCQDSVGIVPGTGNALTVTLPPVRISISSPTTYFMMTQAVFTVSTLKGYGSIVARRVR